MPPLNLDLDHEDQPAASPPAQLPDIHCDSETKGHQVTEGQAQTEVLSHSQGILCQPGEKCHQNGSMMDLLRDTHMVDVCTSEGGSFDGRTDAAAAARIAAMDTPFAHQFQEPFAKSSLDGPSMDGEVIAAAAASAATAAAAMTRAEDQERRASPSMMAAAGPGSPRQTQYRPSPYWGGAEIGAGGVVTTGCIRLRDGGVSNGGGISHPSSPVRPPPGSPGVAMQLSSTKGRRPPPPGEMMYYNNLPTPTRSNGGGGSPAGSPRHHNMKMGNPFAPAAGACHAAAMPGGAHPTMGPVFPMPVQSFYGGPLPTRSGPAPGHMPPAHCPSRFARPMQLATGEDKEAQVQEAPERRSATGSHFLTQAHSGGSGSTLSMTARRPQQNMSGGGGGMQRSHTQPRVWRSQECGTMAEMMNQFRDDDGVVDGQPASVAGYPQAHHHHPYLHMQRPTRCDILFLLYL